MTPKPFHCSFRFLLRVLLILGYLFLVGLLYPAFFTPTNLISIFCSVSNIGILATAVTFVMLVGNVDLSCGAILSLAACISCSFIDVHPVLALLLPLAAGLLCGALNGLLIGPLQLNSFVTTLGTLFIYQSVTFLFTRGQYLSSANTGWYRLIGQGSLFQIPFSVLLFLCLVALSSFVQRRTVFGAQLYSVGSNPVSARFSGISPSKITFITYLISGAGAAISGILLCSRSMAAQPQMGLGFEYDTLAAIVLGGLTLTGGKGGAWGTLLGVVLVGILKNSFILFGLGSEFQSVALGFLLFISIATQQKEGWKK